jgi:uncharacterized protein YjdB
MYAFKKLLCAAGLFATALLAGCGGGSDQGRAPILGLPAADLVSVTVTPAAATIAIGGTQQFSATATFTDGSSRDVTTTATWSSATPAVATVTGTTGLATGLTGGTSAIGATFNGKSAAATLTVTPAQLRSMAVTPVNPSIAIGAKQQLVAMGTYSDGTTRDITASAAFSSASPGVATVTANGGLALGVTAGSSVMTATSGTLNASTVLTVTPAVLVSIALSPLDPVIAIGATRQMTVTASYSDGTTADVSAQSAYTSATPAAATIAASGLVTGVAGGSSIVGATFNGKSASTTVTVSALTLTSIAVTPGSASVAMGATQRFVATATYSNNSTADISATAAWTSSATSVATVLPGGVATAAGTGNATITATAAGKSGSGTLTVTAPLTLTSLAISPLNSSVTAGTSQPFSATGTYSNGSTAALTSSVTWTSSTTAVATINQSGVASALAAGNTTISATLGSQNASTTFTVTAATSTPPAASLNLGAAASFGVLAGTSITNNSGGTTLVTGDVGGFSQTTAPVVAPGFTNYQSGAILNNALAALQVAISDANGRTCDVSSASGIDLGGRTLPPGVYCYAGAITITGTFTMSGPGLYIFRSASTLDTSANSIVALTGGASASDVFWVPVGATTLGANSAFKGSVLAKSAAVTAGDNATVLNGRLLSGAAVTLRNNAITK